MVLGGPGYALTFRQGIADPEGRLGGVAGLRVPRSRPDGPVVREARGSQIRRMSMPSDGSHLLPPPWGRLELPVETTLRHRIGPRDHWFAFRDREIQVASAPVPEGEATPTPEPPEGVEWARWAVPGEGRSVVLRPTLPNRSVVLQPELPFSLLPRAEARIYVRIPLWIRVEMADPERSLLSEVPTVDLSDTWWGSFLEGDLCYWLPTHARREMRAELIQPYLAICPLLLVNRSGTDLRVEKLAFRVAHLSLFAHRGGLWADESVVRYQGEAEGSQIEITGKPPPEASGAIRVADPRIPVSRGFTARTFARLLAFPGLGGGS